MLLMVRRCRSIGSICVAIAFLMVVTASANAAVMIQTSGAPTTGVPGSTTWTVTLVSDNPNEIIFGVDAKFRGRLSQVHPLDIPTPFQDSNGFFEFVGADVSQDSQFLFAAQQLSPPPLAVVDTESLLAAAITNLPAATGGDGLVVPLAQITANECEFESYNIIIDIRSPAGAAIRGETLTGLAFCIPEPLSIAQLMITLTALLSVRRRLPLSK